LTQTKRTTAGDEPDGSDGLPVIDSLKKSEIRYLSGKYGITLTKSLGQNLLTDRNTVTKIADIAAPDGTGHIVEIGPGFGALTAALAIRAEKVTAVEIDARLMPLLSEVLDGAGGVKGAETAGITVINEDFMDFDLSRIAGKWSAAGNLPYYITTPIIMKLVESKNPPERMTFMTQKEAADRITATPGSKIYGAVSVLVGYRCTTEYAMDVSREVFLPKPNVDSAVIVLTRDAQRYPAPKDEALFINVVKTGFGQRRKMLRNPLSQIVSDKEKLSAAFRNAGVAETARAETLSVEEFIALSDAIKDVISAGAGI
jgi:16S rRNA (adenine1518-N6/adenine1519-N6)-dimethyltransferase